MSKLKFEFKVIKEYILLPMWTPNDDKDVEVQVPQVAPETLVTPRTLLEDARGRQRVESNRSDVAMIHASGMKKKILF